MEIDIANRRFLLTRLSQLPCAFSCEHQNVMKLLVGTVANLLILAAIQGLAENQTQFSQPEGKMTGKHVRRKQIPTFVGSDGVVRKVSPIAILEEMKRCLPPGIPIPMAAWPELPSSLRETAEENQVDDEGQDEDIVKKKEFEMMVGSVNGMEDEHSKHDWKKRVMRSNGGGVKNRSDDLGVASGDGLNVKLELPARESVIFSPTEPNQRKFADVLKEMFSKLGKNSTGFDLKYVDEGAVVDRFKKNFKPKNMEDYVDYDYEEEASNKLMKGRAQLRSRPRDHNRLTRNQHVGRRRGTTRRDDIPLKMNPNTRRNIHGKDSGNVAEYDYDYEDTAEDPQLQEDSTKEFRIRMNRQRDVPRDELERQIELNEYLGALTKRLADAKNEGEYVEKQRSKLAKYSTRVGAVNQAKDYKQVLASVIELNSSLVRLLERAIFSAICQNRAKPDEPDGSDKTDDKIDLNKDDESSATSFLLECMEILMQKRKSLREKRDNGLPPTQTKHQDSYQKETRNAPQHFGGSRRTKHRLKLPAKTTDLNLLKWLLKWYLTVST